MKMYYCWITVTESSYQDGIILGLASKGYMVGAASKDGQILTPTNPQAPAVLLVLSIYNAKPETNADKIYEDVIDILINIKAEFYSLIIASASEAIWAGSNMSLPNNKVSDDVKDSI